MSVEKTIIFGEVQNGQVASVVLELATFARNIASSVELVGFDPKLAEEKDLLGSYGISKIHIVKGILEELPAPKLSQGISELLQEVNSSTIVLIGATYDGRDLAGRLSAKLDVPVITNVVGLEALNGDLVASHSVFGGTLVVKSKFDEEVNPKIFVVKAKTFAAEPGNATSPEINELEIKADVADTAKAKIIARHVEEVSGPKLDEADIVVSGGRGLGEKENYQLIETLAKLLKGAPGASRAIVDAGWVPYSHQVGQTGKTVKPNVYIACGISGATQHLVGMKNSKNIIAINKDKDAPIFSVADLGIVGDVHKVLPKLVESLQARSS